MEMYDNFRDVFAVMKIGKKELEQAEDELYLPEMSHADNVRLSDKGIDIENNIKDFETVSFKDYKNIFTYKKRPIIVYIQDQSFSREQYYAGQFSKYHLCYCKNLRKRKDFKKRYVMTRRTDGKFWIKVTDNKSPFETLQEYGYQKLVICQDCLRELNWKNFRKYCGNNPDDDENWYLDEKAKKHSFKRNAKAENFQIEEFLEVMRGEVRVSMKNPYLEQQSRLENARM